MLCFGLSVALQEAGADVTTVDVCYWLKVSLCPVYMYMNKMMLKMYFKLKSCNASMRMGRKWIKTDIKILPITMHARKTATATSNGWKMK